MYLAEEHSVIIPAIPDLVWGTVSFLIVAIAVYKFAWPTLTKMLDERREKIEEGLLAAERAREEVAQERATIQSEKDAAVREAADIRAQAQSNASDIIERARREAGEEARRISAAAQVQIKADTDAAARILRADLGTMASQLAGRIVGEQIRLDPSVNQGVVDSFLDNLEEQARTGA